MENLKFTTQKHFKLCLSNLGGKAIPTTGINLAVIFF